eukprot:6196273-Pleurochrysis_carterae.AAC.1
MPLNPDQAPDTSSKAKTSCQKPRELKLQVIYENYQTVQKQCVSGKSRSPKFCELRYRDRRSMEIAIGIDSYLKPTPVYSLGDRFPLHIPHSNYARPLVVVAAASCNNRGQALQYTKGA